MRIGTLLLALAVGVAVSAAPAARAEHKDGEADKAEKTKLGHLFDKLDANHDGKLNRDEFGRLHEEIAKQKDGAISSQEFEKYFSDVARDEGKIDLFKGAIDLSIYTIIVFLVLFAILRAFAWKPIAAGLDARENAIARDKHEADLARQEAASTRDKLTAQMAQADAEVRAKMDKARTDAEALAADRAAQSKAELAAERERLYRELGISRDQAMKEVLDSGAKLAVLVSAKTIKKHLTEQDHRALLDEALREFRAAAEKRKSDLENATA
jgi:F-type H+-transporting ATPase subunit b